MTTSEFDRPIDWLRMGGRFGFGIRFWTPYGGRASGGEGLESGSFEYPHTRKATPYTGSGPGPGNLTP